MSFAVFGLGNRQYEHFCSVGKRIYKVLQSLGATAIGPRGDGDDDEDIEADFDSWRSQLYEALDESGMLTKTKVSREGSLLFSANQHDHPGICACCSNRFQDDPGHSFYILAICFLCATG